MIIEKELNRILYETDIFSKIFEVIRVIKADGTNKILYSSNSDYGDNLRTTCHSFWERTDRCHNCVSQQACNENKQMVKLEYHDERYYFVIARPIIFMNQRCTLELITNITTQLSRDSEDDDEYQDGFFITDLINQLERVSNRDTFTGVFNKSFLAKDLNARLEEARKKEKELFMALLDIDNFKRANDTYGHAFGDRVLKRVVKIMSRKLPTDMGYVARFGGDEFGIVFFMTDIRQIRDIMRDIKEEIDAHEYKVGNNMVHVTISYGVGEVSSASDFAEAIAIADKPLYREKKKKKENL